MSKQIETLVSDIYDLFDKTKTSKVEVKDEYLEAFKENIGNTIKNTTDCIGQQQK